MATPARPTIAEVLVRIDRTWNDLEATLQGLDARELAEVRDPAGWAVKDHLVHLVAWEGALMADLDGRPRHEALGIQEGLVRAGDDETINAAIYARHRDRPLVEVLDEVRAMHHATRTRIASLVESGTITPSGELQGTGSPLAKPGSEALRGNTYEHYAEHHRWIRELIAHARG